MTGGIQHFISNLNLAKVLRLGVYPFTLLLTTPFVLLRSLVASISLLKPGRSTTPHFCPHASVNCLFYWNRALNFFRYGRNGTSPTIGLGDYKLSSFFHFSLPSVYGYWFMGAGFVLLMMIVWLATFAVWWTTVAPVFVVICLVLLLISSTFYANTFYVQNYNVMGWAFLPLALYGLMTGHYVIAAMAWFVISLGSFTVVFMGCFICATQALVCLELGALLCILPACMKIALHFLPLFSKSGDGSALKRRARAIGMTRDKVKYQRPPKRLTVVDLYHLALPLQLGVVLFLVQGIVPWLLLCAMGLYVLNARIVRFADFQSSQMLVATVGASYMIASGNGWVIASGWLLISPIPVAIVTPFRKKLLDHFPPMRPTNLGGVLSELEAFLAPVPAKSRALITFSDPGGDYSKVFDGYRVPLEAINYATARKEILLLPNWEAVFQLNYEGAPDFWVNAPAEAPTKMREWDTQYLVVQAPEGEPIDPAYAAMGFESLSSFRWLDHPEVWNGIINFGQTEAITWHLLKPSAELLASASAD